MENCSGGAATCTQKATCTGCSAAYGAVDPDAHTLSYTVAGNQLTETCTVCNNHSETAELRCTQENMIYKAAPWTPCAVTYSTGWKGSKPEIQYTGNVDAGTAEASITVGSATAVKTFTIGHRSITDGITLTVVPAFAGYTGSAHVPEVKLQFGDTVLQENEDYTFTWDKELINPGNYTVSVFGKGNYEGSATGTYTIDKAQPKATHFIMTPPADLTYNGSLKTATVVPASGTVNAPSDIAVSYYQGGTKLSGAPVNAGEYTVKINVAGNDYYTAATELEVGGFTINPVSIGNAAVTLSQNTFIYDGAPHKPVTAISLSGFGDLEANVDYTVDYSLSGTQTGSQQCIDAGVYSVVVEGKGNFTSSVYASFTIEKATPTAAHFKFVAAQNMVYDGAQKAVTVEPAAGVVGMGEITCRFKTSENGAYGDAAIDAGTYWVGIEVAEGSNFVASTDVITASDWKFTIEQAELVAAAPKAATLTYNGTAQNLVTAGVANGNQPIYYKLGEKGTWDTVIPTAANVGEYTVYWYAGSETGNYKYVSGSLKTEIKPATLTVTPDADQKMTYGKVRETLTYTVKGVITPEVPVFTGELTVYGKDAGTYEIMLGTLKLKDNGTFKAANYELKLEKVKFVINPAYVALTAEDQIITCGATIDSRKYTITDLAGDDVATVTLMPSSNGVTYGGTITPAAVIKNEDGEDVSKNYNIAVIPGKLVIEPDFAVVENVTTENVSPSQKDAIKALLDSLNSADTAKATDAQKKRIEEVKTLCAVLLERIEKSTQAMETDAVKNSVGITAENVKIADKAVIEQAVKDIEKAKADFAGNYAAEDVKKLDHQIAQLKGALETIEHAQTVIDLLSALPETVKAEDAAAAEARAAIQTLTEYEKELVKASGSGKLLEAVSYKIISGSHDTWVRGENLTFKIDGDYSRFTGVKVDGKTVDEKFYTAEAGSTVVTLKKAYLKKLGAGTDHTIQFRFDDGEVDGVFYVSKDAARGGFSFLGTLIWLIVLATAAGAAYLFIRKKKNG